MPALQIVLRRTYRSNPDVIAEVICARTGFAKDASVQRHFSN
jgi:hypothetical protein